MMLRKVPAARVVLVGVAALLLASGGGTFAAFTATDGNTSTVTANTDWTPPTVTATTLVKDSGGAIDHLKPGSSYYVYANVTDAGSPATGTSDVRADVSGITAGQTSVALAAGSFEYPPASGTTYTHRSALLTAGAHAALTACGNSYSVTATDAGTPRNDATKSGHRAMTDRDLADYNIRLDGASASNAVGKVIAGAGDVNGDGKDDVIVGDAAADNNLRTDSGSAYVIFGRTTTAAIDLSSLGSDGFRIDGAQGGDAAGSSVAGAGDVNLDGYGDVLVGANRADNNLRDASGSVYVVFGSATPAAVDLLTFGTGSGYRIDGRVASGFAGDSVANAGDVNADGKPDALVGATGVDEAYVVFGKTSNTTVDLNAIGTAGYQIDGPASSLTGGDVAGVGDVNSDGKADTLIGAEGSDVNSTNHGSAYVVHGKSDNNAVDLTSYTTGFRIDGTAANRVAGEYVAGAGDVNGDAIPDLLIGERLSPGVSARTDSGSAFVVFGKAGTGNVALATIATNAAGYQIVGAAAADYLSTVAGVGDVNGDGKADALVGAYRADVSGRTDAGAAYVVFGKSDTTVVDLAALGARGYVLEGAAATNDAGNIVANAGDTNGDGRTDFLVGAPGADNNSRSNSGSASVMHGPTCNESYSARATADPGLAGYWRLSEPAGSGTTAYGVKDLNNGTYVNGPTLGGTGVFDGDDMAPTFDGSNDYVDLGNATSLQLSTGTVEAWVKTSTPGSSYRGILSKGSAYGMLLKDGVFMTRDWNGGSDRSTGVNLADGQWHHVVMTFRSGVTNGTKLYSDGVLRLTTTVTLTGQTTSLQIGASAAPTDSQYLNGQIDEPAVYNRVMSGTEIAKRYALDDRACSSYVETVACTPGAVGHWRFAETSGTTATAAVGTVNGTYSGSPTFSATGPVESADKAVTFDGVDDRVDFGNPTAFELSRGAVEAWVKTSSPGAGNRGILVKPSAFGLFLQDGVLNTYDWSTSSNRNTGVNLADNQWHHVAMTFDSGKTNGTRLYVDGVLKLTTTLTVSAQTEALQVGQNQGTQFLNGSIDEPAIYNRVLSGVEIAAHYKARLAQGCSWTRSYTAAVMCTPNLIHYWRLGEPSGTVSNDVKLASTATYAGGVTRGSAGAFSVDTDSSVLFDSTGTVDLSGLDVDTATGAWNTVEFWMYWNGGYNRMPFAFSGSYDLWFDNTVVNAFGFNSGASDVWGIDPSSPSLANKWVHVVAEFYNGDAKKSRIWIDGAERTLTQRRGTTGTKTVASSARISGLPGDASYMFNAGRLDEVAIYNRALTTEEIRAHYDAR